MIEVDLAPDQVRSVGLAILCPTTRNLRGAARRERHAQRGGDTPGDAVLDGENRRQVPVVALRPEVHAVRGPDELGGDTEVVAGTTDGALDKIADAELVSDAPGDDRSHSTTMDGGTRPHA